MSKESSAADDREVAVGGDGTTPILDSVTGEPIRVPCEPRSAALKFGSASEGAHPSTGQNEPVGAPDSHAALSHDSAFVCRYPDCKRERLVRSIWCEEHRYPQAREDGRCLATSCGYPRTDETPWCHEHTRRNEQAEELSALRDLVGRAAFVAEHLFQMIDPQTWRDSGGDDMQGHYEGDYHAEQTQLEIERWKEEVAR